MSVTVYHEDLMYLIEANNCRFLFSLKLEALKNGQISWLKITRTVCQTGSLETFIVLAPQGLRHFPSVLWTGASMVIGELRLQRESSDLEVARTAKRTLAYFYFLDLGLSL